MYVARYLWLGGAELPLIFVRPITFDLMVKVYCFCGRNLPSLVGVVALATTPQILLRLAARVERSSTGKWQFGATKGLAGKEGFASVGVNREARARATIHEASIKAPSPTQASITNYSLSVFGSLHKPSSTDSSGGPTSGLGVVTTHSRSEMVRDMIVRDRLG